MLLTLAACGPDPNAGALERRTAAQLLRLAERHEVIATAALETALAEAEQLAAEERQAPFWRRGGRARAAWERVAVRNAALAADVRRARRAAIDTWQELSRETEAALARAREQVGDPGMGAAATHHLSQGRTLMRQAHGLALAGELERASRAALRALAAAERIDESWQALHERFDRPELLALWQGWVGDSLREAEPGRPVVVVDKLRRRLEVFAGGGRPSATFAVDLGVNGLARKLVAGDRATPEGRYRVVEKRGPGATRYYKALMLDYPTPEDVRRWRRASADDRRLARTGPGGLIEIHGEGGRGRDWTDGCVALSNADMDRLFDMVQIGSPVTIVGTYDTAAGGS